MSRSEFTILEESFLDTPQFPYEAPVLAKALLDQMGLMLQS